VGSDHHNSAKWTFLGPILIGVALSAMACALVPWVRVHPLDASLRESLGYAPLWSHRFLGVTGAHVDWVTFAINLAVIWIIALAAALLLSMSMHRNT
jgi:hypothetical protein